MGPELWRLWEDLRPFESSIEVTGRVTPTYSIACKLMKLPFVQSYFKVSVPQLNVWSIMLAGQLHGADMLAIIEVNSEETVGTVVVRSPSPVL
eukprot:CAMPEP_0204909714 /NCGR_PEP_ID=MMETSP1397-20131031/8386_1 /ASSEMBLY_ACC=CAM_ASM_000891 /TAXON_ID=49980 /ORGANISM="Climacostomum Climacostomum virens, Strain Stock W-24" /LENGTH=92 /DNA_ID=CAMNT_0052079627 /DNA_START=393 /DNA_END=668 /DNA_ORIENTATION=-